MKQPPPSTFDIIEYVLLEAARAINRYPHQPHRVFTEKPESLESYHYRLHSLYAQSKYHNEEYHDELCVNYLTACLEDIKRPAMPICYGLAKLALRLVKENKLIFDFPEYDPRKARDPAYASYTRQRLEEIEPYLLHEERIREVFGYGVCLNITGLTGELPPVCFPESDEGLFTAPLHDLLPDAADLTQKIIGTFLSDIAYDDEYPASLAFAQTRSQLVLNILKASKMSPEEARKHPQRIVLPEASKLTSPQIIDTYLAGTPLHQIFQAKVPIEIPMHSFRAHGCMFSPSGGGKTQTLQALILNFLKQDDPPALFIIDAHGDMLKKIEALAVWNTTLKDQLIILDCTAENPPALNFFDIGARDPSDPQTVELFTYLFSAIDQELTTKQETAVTYLIELMEAIPDSTLDTLLSVMEDHSKTAEQSPYWPYIKTFHNRAQLFFKNQFFNRAAMGQTREQVAGRLYTLLRNPTFAKIFGATENRFDAFRAMQEKKIVLVNTSPDKLGRVGSKVFGRYFLALCAQAAFKRKTIPEKDRHLALLIIDEAAPYLDSQAEMIMTETRKFGLGLFFCTQYLEQLPPQVKAAVNGNTAIKMAGAVSHNDAMMLAREMYTTGDFIRSMRPVDRSHTEFAIQVQGVIPHAIKVTIPYGVMESETKMSAEVAKKLGATIRLTYAGRDKPPPHRSPPVIETPQDTPKPETEPIIVTPSKDY